MGTHVVTSHRVPNLHGLVPRTASHTFAIMRERNRVHTVLVARYGAHLYQQLQISTQSKKDKYLRVPQVANLLAGHGVPDLHCPVI
jgi:hypothetical protein